MGNELKTWDMECLVHVVSVRWHNVTANTDFTMERVGLFPLESTSGGKSPLESTSGGKSPLESTSGGKSGQQVQTYNHSESPICWGKLVVPTNLSVCCMVCFRTVLQSKRWPSADCTVDLAAAPTLFILTEYISQGNSGLRCCNARNGAVLKLTVGDILM
jgi:hypothetical protein